MGKVTVLPMAKNAISMLNELLQAGKIANYVFSEDGMSGTQHQPIFVIKAIVRSKGKIFTGTGKASKKNAAKAVAATAVLKKLGFNVEEISMPVSKSYTTEDTARSRLNRIHQQEGYPAPVYSDGPTSGPDHEPTFMVNVYFAGQEASGKGKTRKAAQEAAASALLELL